MVVTFSWIGRRRSARSRFLPAYRRTDKDNFVDSAGFMIGDSQPSEQYSAEARLVSNSGGPIDYIFGAYYFSERISDLQSASTGGAASFTDSHYQTHSPAGYARLTWHVTDRLRLTGGVRYTSDSKSFSSASSTLAYVCLCRRAARPAPLRPTLKLKLSSPSCRPKAAPWFRLDWATSWRAWTAHRPAS